MEEIHSFKICNQLEGISIRSGYLGSSEILNETGPGSTGTLEIAMGKILNIWLNPIPGIDRIPGKIILSFEETSEEPSGPDGNYASQVIRSFGIPPVPGAVTNIETPIWTIILGNLDFSPSTTHRKVGRLKRGVNVTISSPEIDPEH